jgi:hypothetical protein
VTIASIIVEVSTFLLSICQTEARPKGFTPLLKLAGFSNGLHELLIASIKEFIG